MSPQKKIIVDSGFIVALFHEGDGEHKKAVELIEKFGDDSLFVSTLFVVQEICWLLSSRVGHHKVIEFLKLIQDETLLQLPPLPVDWIEKATHILHKYTNRKLDLADASIVVLADHINLGDILSVDRKDFSVLRWGNGKKQFTNLMHDTNIS